MSLHTLVDLFAGCGGLSLGLEHDGFKTVFFNELVPTYAETYIANRKISKDHYFIGDINELNKKIENYSSILLNTTSPIDLVSGGPPCQGFSSANRQRIIDDPRNQLYKAFLFFLSKVRPKFFVMENVRGMANKYSEICENLKDFLGDE